MKMKRMIAFVAAFAVAFSGVSYSRQAEKQVEAADGWDLVWSDEFDGTSLNTNTWNYEIGTGNWGWGNNEQQYYTSRTENVEVSDGTLKIKALRENNYNNSGKNYTSGRITTQGKKDFKYGRIEARMKLPSFTGSWPAFWMLGANFSSVGWPKCGEIDIMEAINNENNTYGYIHWNVESTDYNGQGDTGSSSVDNLPSGYNRTEWHTYGIEWTETEMKWYIDDKVFLTQDISADHMSEFRRNQYIILNLAIGGQWPGYTIDDSAFPSRSVMEVDYVRVYQQPEEPETTTTFDGETVVTYETVDSVAVNTGTFGTFFGGDIGWGSVTGSASDSTNTGITLHANSVGDELWMIQASLLNLRYVAGNTYTYKCTITSDVTKSVRVKVVGDDDSYIFSQDDITVQAGVPYYYEKQITIPADYDFEGRLDLYFGLGKNHFVNENIDSNTAMNITISDASFVTEEKNITYIPRETTTVAEQTTLQPTTAQPTTLQPTTAQPTTVQPTEGTTTTGLDVTTAKPSDNETTSIDTTTQRPSEEEKTTSVEATTTGNIKVTPPNKTKVKKVKKKSAKIVKIFLKKIKGANGYRVKISSSKKFKKSKTVTKNVNKTNFKIKSKKFKNKKKLYVKARAYKKVNGKKIYGKWSNIKTLKVKK